MGKSNQTGDNQFFRGRVLIVYLVNASGAFSGGIAVANPRLEEHYGRIFLVGEVPTSRDDWASGLRIGIGFDQVAHFLEFSDLDEYIQKTSSMPGKVGSSFQ